MRPTEAPLGEVAAISRRIAQRLLTIGHNRVELLLIELQEERERLLLAILLALGSAALGLLAGVVLTMAIVLLFAESLRVPALLAFFLIYGLSATLLYLRLARLQREWKTLPATMDQLHKDRQCLAQTPP